MEFKPDGTVDEWSGDKEKAGKENIKTEKWEIKNGEVYISIARANSKGTLGLYLKLTAGNDLEWVAIEEEEGRKDVDDIRLGGNRKIPQERRIWPRIK